MRNRRRIRVLRFGRNVPATIVRVSVGGSPHTNNVLVRTSGDDLPIGRDHGYRRPIIGSQRISSIGQRKRPHLGAVAGAVLADQSSVCGDDEAATIGGYRDCGWQTDAEKIASSCGWIRIIERPPSAMTRLGVRSRAREDGKKESCETTPN